MMRQQLQQKTGLGPFFHARPTLRSATPIYSIKTVSNAYLPSADSYAFLFVLPPGWPDCSPDRCYSCAMTEDMPKPAPESAPQPRNPLHGVTLETMVAALADYFGWQGLGERIPVRCFQSEPSVASSLTFLRKTPWAREKVEGLYLFMLREQRRNAS